ncbi:MAG TPA: alanine racemase, partial [Firmicutes bacterium]|nr:alanine racemase [Bacillota bacterium]
MTETGYVRPVWVEVNLEYLAFNFRQVRRVTGDGVKVMAVIKGAAYGAGIAGIIDTLLAEGADMLGVGILDEALLVRSLGVRTPVLVFGYTPFACSELLVKNEITQTVYCYEQAAALSAAAAALGRDARVHLEIDTGMGRLGFLPNDAAFREIKAIAALPQLKIDGIYTHCPYTNEREGAGCAFTGRQFAVFTQFVRRLAEAGIMIPLRHAANSLGIVHYPEMHLEMVRAGIILYGSYPSFQQVLPQKTVMALKTRIGSVKYVPAGHNISYGHTFTA